MSRFCSPALAAATILAGITGCMNPYYNQPYPGQQGYGMPGMMAQPGVISVPPSSSTPQPLGNGGSTFQPDTAPKDDFNTDGGDAPFFQRNQDSGGVPPARDPGAAGSGTDSSTFPLDNK